jgi:hypothetical protein
METVVRLYCSGHNDKKKICACQYRGNFPPNIFELWLVEPTELEPAGRLLTVHGSMQVDHMQIIYCFLNGTWASEDFVTL